VVTYAASALVIEEVTHLNSEGERKAYAYTPSIPIALLSYGRNIIITLTRTNVAQTSVKFVISKNVMGGNYEAVGVYIREFENAKASIEISLSGLLKISCIAINAVGTETPLANQTDIIVRSDTTPPPEPTVDVSVFEQFNQQAINVEFCINPDIDGIGIAYNEKSLYRYEDEFGNVVFLKYLTALNMQSSWIADIDCNGKLVFELYDLVGNHSTYFYNYVKHGQIETAPPIITISPDSGYARAISVAISWGEDYDNSTEAIKEYSYITPVGSVIFQQYSSPFEITQEGRITIRAYYYSNGQKLYVEKIVDSIDRTPPDLATIADSITIYCDLMSVLPIFLTVRATDIKSGIKRVYLGTGEDLSRTSDNMYMTDIFGMRNITIKADDHAGNTVEYSIYNLNYNYEVISEYSDRFATLDSNDYTQTGWIAVQNTYNALSRYLVDKTAQTGYIQQLRTELNDAINGVSKIVTRIAQDGVSEIPGIIFFEFNADTFNMKLGTEGRVIIGNAKILDSEKNSIKEKLLSDDIKDRPHTSSFNIRFEDLNGESINVIGDYSMKILIPESMSNCSIYIKSGEEIIKLENTSESGGYLIVHTNQVGDFFIIGSKPKPGVSIFGRFFTYDIIWIFSSIGGVILIVGTTVIIVQIKKLKK
jgi:hypothetical protein